MNAYYLITALSTIKWIALAIAFICGVSIIVLCSSYYFQNIKKQLKYLILATSFCTVLFVLIPSQEKLFVIGSENGWFDPEKIQYLTNIYKDIFYYKNK